MHSTKKGSYKFKILTGHVALAACGVPAEFASRCMFMLSKYKLTAAWRVGDTNEEEARSDSVATDKKRLTMEHASYPKPSDVKEKSSNWGFTKWYIADDPVLGKYDHHNLPVNSGIKRSTRVEPTQHFVTMRFILNGLNKTPPVMKLLAVDDHSLIISCLDAPPRAPSIYRILFDKSILPAQIDVSPLQVLPDSARIKPDWWPERYSFAVMLDSRFPVEVTKSNYNHFEPVRVLAIQDSSTQQLIPIITDLDLLWISKPHNDIPLVAEARKLGIPIFEVLNTFNEPDSKKLRSILKQMRLIDHQLFGKENPEFLDNLNLETISDETLARMGCVTPFVAYFILSVNQHFGMDIEHLQDLMQHAPEIFNPNQPSALGCTLNIAGGEIIHTLCEEDQITLALDLVDGGYQIPLHPQWDMKKWGKVVERLQKNGYAIDPAVLQSYNELKDREERALLSRPTALFFSVTRRASQTMQSLVPVIPRKSSTGSHIQARRKDSAGIYIVQIHCPDIDVMHVKSSLLETTKQKLLTELCSAESNPETNIRWKMTNKQSLEIQVHDKDLEFTLCKFRIDAARISLVSGEVNDFSLEILKKLSDKLFENKPVVVAAMTDDNKEKAEKIFSPLPSKRML